MTKISHFDIEKFAEAFVDRVLAREVRVTFNLSYTTRVKVPIGKELDDVLEDIPTPASEGCQYVDDSFNVVDTEEL